MIRQLHALLVFFFFLSVCSFGLAQSAQIQGQVSDSSGAVIQRATVRVVNQLTGTERKVSTNGSGQYSVPGLDPSVYKIFVQASGFSTAVSTQITLNVAQNAVLDFTMLVGSTDQNITVDGSRQQINTTDASVSTVIDRNFVENLPLNGRSFNTLLQLTPGVVIAQQPGGSATAPGQFSISGQRTDGNNFTVDGVSANFGVTANGLFSGQSGLGSAQAFSALGGTSSLVSVDALQEFRIDTSSFAPEFGKSPGGQVILTTRSGTNDFHGGIFEYFRNDVMDANDWFAKQAGSPRPEERHNDFGGFLGGPVIKNRSFFFFSYEGARLRLPRTSITVVPYLNSTGCFAPASVAPFLLAYPKANGPISTSTCTGQLTGSFSNQATLNATALRLDHTINKKLSIFARYNFAPSQTVSRIYALSSLETAPVNTQTATVGINMLFTPALVNTARFNYSSQRSSAVDSQSSFNGSTPLNTASILGSLSPSDNLFGFETFDTDLYSQGPTSRNKTSQLNLVDDLNSDIGRHHLKFGIDYRAILFDKIPYNNNVVFVSDTVVDIIESQQLLLLGSTTYAPTYLLAQSNSLYAQDTWNLTHELTMTYGLRWEIAPAPSSRNGTKLASWMKVDTPSQISLAPLGTPLWKTTYGNIAPRIGIAYSLGKKKNTVLRGGLGSFYDLGVGQVADTGTYFPGSASTSTYFVPLPVTNVSPYLATLSLESPYPNVDGFSPNLQMPRTYEWNAAVEHSFNANQTISITYVGSSGRKLLRQMDQYQPNTNFSAAFLLTGNQASSNYNSLQVQYRRSLSGNLQILAGYTYAHSLDSASNDVVAGLSNTIISAANDYASSDYDVRHSISGAATYSVPGFRNGIGAALSKDWMLDAVLVARTGFPFNGTVRSLSSVTGGYASSRPDRVPGQPTWIPNSSAADGRSLNPNAFVVPSVVRQGTEARNDIAGFRMVQLDMSASRKFALRENVGLTFKVDAFNIANHPNFTNPSAIIGSSSVYLESSEMLNNGLGGLNPLFQEGGPRSLQLSLTLKF